MTNYAGMLADINGIVYYIKRSVDNYVSFAAHTQSRPVHYYKVGVSSLGLKHNLGQFTITK